MVYLDYSATTPVNKEVLESFNKACLDFPGNPNSLHRLGTSGKKLIDDATEQIKKILNTNKEVIYTSGSSESNNTVIKGIASRYKNRGKHIITSPFEHSSIIAPLNYLMDNEGFKVDIVNLDENGMVDLNHLKSLMTDDTILVTIASVNSELGLLQPIPEIAKIVKEYPKCYFHSDMTQSVGKVNVCMDDVDFVSFSAHKFFGLKGIGCLLKNENIIVKSETGSGKTHAFLIPLLSNVKFNKKLQAIILTPTRELGRQTYAFIDQVRKYEYYKNRLGQYFRLWHDGFLFYISVGMFNS